jgi:histone H3/H4
MDQRRRTIFTPGRARRRSLRDQRETPHDILRNLSRVLAPTSQAMRYSSSSSSPRRDAQDSTHGTIHEEEDDDDFPIERPRFSLPLHEDDDDDSDLKAPRLSGLEEENYTSTSIELPRRAWNEGQSRLGRESLGSVRFSDYAGPELRSDDVGVDSGFFPPPPMDDDSGNVMMDEEDVLERYASKIYNCMQDTDVLTIYRIDADEMRRQTLGRDSLFGPIEIPEGGNESTFMMAGVESPTRDLTAGEFEDNDDNVDAGGDAEGPEVMEEYDDHVNEPMDWPDSDDNGDIEAPADDHEEVEQQDETIVSHTADLPARATKRRGTGKQISRYGIEYPLLPKGVVKRLATTFAKTSGSGKARISADTMDALMQATDWFFEQLGDDLRAYAKHAGRTTINESDIITLMRRYVYIPSIFSSQGIPLSIVQPCL